MRTLLFSLSMGLMVLTSTAGVGGATGITAPTNHHNGRTAGGTTHGRTYKRTHGITPARPAHPNVNAADRPHAHGRNLH